jgi:hypothetical protein
LEIRRAAESDIDAIVELNRQIGLMHFEHVPQVFCAPSVEERDFLLNAIRNEGRLFCVAVDNEQVLGFLSARIDINEAIPFLTKLSICHISSVVVDEKHRGEALARSLSPIVTVGPRPAMLVRSGWKSCHSMRELSRFTSPLALNDSLKFMPDSVIWQAMCEAALQHKIVNNAPVMGRCCFRHPDGERAAGE